jgi:hypothetical protein
MFLAHKLAESERTHAIGQWGRRRGRSAHAADFRHFRKQTRRISFLHCYRASLSQLEITGISAICDNKSALFHTGREG